MIFVDGSDEGLNDSNEVGYCRNKVGDSMVVHLVSCLLTVKSSVMKLHHLLVPLLLLLLAAPKSLCQLWCTLHDAWSKLLLKLPPFWFWVIVLVFVFCATWFWSLCNTHHITTMYNHYIPAEDYKDKKLLLLKTKF